MSRCCLWLELALLALSGCAVAPATAPRDRATSGAMRHPAGPTITTASAEANAANALPVSISTPLLPDPVTLDALEQLAVANHPSLRQAAAGIDAAEGLRVQGALPPNPIVGYSGSEIGDQGRAGQQGAFVSQELVTGGKLRLNRAVADQAVQQARWQAVAQRRRVLADVRIRFYEVLAAQRGAELAAQLSQTAQRAVDAARRRFDAGDVSRPDVQQAEIEAAQSDILLGNADNRSHAAWRRVAVAVGSAELDRVGVQGSLEDSLPQLEWDDAWQKLLDESPDLQFARAGLERAQAALARARAEPVPNLLAEAGVQYDAGSLDTIANVQLGVALPIWDRNQGNIQAAQAAVRRARDEVARVELALRDGLAAAFERYQDARQQVDIYRERILPAARESLDLISEGYRQGEFDLARLLLAQRTLFETNLAYLDALVALRRAVVEIESLLLPVSSDPSS